MFQFLYHNLNFLATIDTAKIRNSRPVVFCKKDVLTNFTKFTRKHLRKTEVEGLQGLQSLTFSKKRFRRRCFLVNSAKFLITLPLKNPLDGCFCINTRSVNCPTTTFSFYQKQCHTYFPPEYFLNLIYRLGTRVSSIFQTLSQTPTTQSNICDGAFFFKNSQQLKGVKYFHKKNPL